MKLKQNIQNKIDAKFDKFGWYNSFKNDSVFRTLVITIGGVAINVAFAVFNGVTALKYSSLWYGVFCGYYLILGLLRVEVLFAYRRIKQKSADDAEKLHRGKLKIYLANGAFFVPLDIALAAAITIMNLRSKPTSTGDIMAITSATYTTYKVTMAIRNLVKAKKQEDFVIQTIRNIGIVDALASLISLETTLISTFGEFDDSMRTIMATSGFVVCAFTVGLGLYMIIKAAKALKGN